MILIEAIRSRGHRHDGVDKLVGLYMELIFVIIVIIVEIKQSLSQKTRSYCAANWPQNDRIMHGVDITLHQNSS